MRQFFETLWSHPPAHVVLRGSAGAVTCGELRDATERAVENFRAIKPRVIGLALDNSPAWATLDLAAMTAEIPLVPLPFFFSPGQLAHAIRDAGINCILTDQPQNFLQLFADMGVTVSACQGYTILGQPMMEFHLADVAPAELPTGTLKITYTSGTTGNPKGVCLGWEAMSRVAHSLREATGANADDRHVSLMPLSTLLENIAGLYVPLLAGACPVLLSLAEVGLRGASGADVKKMAATLNACDATTTILTPELLRGLIAVTHAGGALPKNLRFVAVGGAAVSAGLLAQAAQLGIPAYEGYGLSECASVVSLNTASENLRGSVGKPLPHARIAFAEDGEILVAGANMLGYTGDATRVSRDDYWPTGDLGFLDDDGFLHIIGRKKNVFITSFGRNVAPEWVERELAQHPAIMQVAVFGEARPWNAAVIAPVSATLESVAAINDAIRDVNRHLPDYARIRRWIPARAPFQPANEQLTANGRLRRDAIFAAYRAELDNLYEEETHAVL
ncbi:MAG: AMP-binding protein [Methylobacillus sp.]|jgi:long-subunit acyl-CoA synthetase (AMP-forming)|nr:AMP-binding protein [Methylobacillus sp.]